MPPATASRIRERVTIPSRGSLVPAGTGWVVAAAGAGVGFAAAGVAGAVVSAAGAATAPPSATACWTSSRRIRPPTPVPLIAPTSNPFSATSLRTSGTAGPRRHERSAPRRCPSRSPGSAQKRLRASNPKKRHPRRGGCRFRGGLFLRSTEPGFRFLGGGLSAGPRAAR